VVSSLLGRLITGPFAFLLAGIYDFTAFFSVFAYRSLRTRARARNARD
jgi:hypothetical protein